MIICLFFGGGIHVCDNAKTVPTFSFYEQFLQSRDRMGTKKAKPLWTEIMDLMGDEYAEITKNFYVE